MVDKDKIIKEQGEQIDALKKALAVLNSRLAQTEKRNRTNETKIFNNARDIRNVAIQLQALQQALQRQR